MAGHNPTLTIVNDKIHMYVPFALNATFRTLFKTARWLPSQKVFEASNTTSNKNKWQKFLVATLSAQEKLAEAEHLEATESELVALKRSAEDAVTKIEGRIKAAESGIVAAENAISKINEQKNKLAPILEEAEARLEAHLQLQKQAEEARNATIAPVFTLYENHNLNGILREFRWGASRKYNGKEALRRARARLTQLTKDLAVVGYQVKALNDLCDVSLNRYDKVPELVDAVEYAKLSGLVAVQNTD